MFEKTVLRRALRGTAVSWGDIAEALLFYQNVHLVIDYSTFGSLVENSRLPDLLSLVQRPGVSAVYVEETLGTRSQELIPGGWLVHNFCAFFVSGHQGKGEFRTPERRLQEVLLRKGYSTAKSRKLARQFLARVPYRKLAGDHFVKDGVVRAATNDIFQPTYVLSGLQKLAAQTPGLEAYATNLVFDVTPAHEGGFRVYTNIDFDATNVMRKAIDPSLPALSEAYLATLFLDASGDTVLAAHYGGEFVTSEAASTLVRVRHAELLKRAGISADELTQFQEVCFPVIPPFVKRLTPAKASYLDS